MMMMIGLKCMNVACRRERARGFLLLCTLYRKHLVLIIWAAQSSHRARPSRKHCGKTSKAFLGTPVWHPLLDVCAFFFCVCAQKLSSKFSLSLSLRNAATARRSLDPDSVADSFHAVVSIIIDGAVFGGIARRCRIARVAWHEFGSWASLAGAFEWKPKDGPDIRN